MPGFGVVSDGVLVIDETGDRKDGHHTAHVGRQYLANLGKVDNGVVPMTSLWADERVYYPVDVEPYTPTHHFEKGKKDPQFRTKLKIAVELVRRAVQAKIPFRAMRRHWQLVCCAFSFCWYHASHGALSTAQEPLEASEPSGVLQSGVPAPSTGAGKKISEEQATRPQISWSRALRAIRGWLEPWIMLRRYWNGWSQQPPPPAHLA